MRNIEALKNYFLGKDPQLKETMADNSLRLIGIPGREFVLRPELMRKLKILRDELVEKDQELADKIDEAVAEMERVAASIPFTMLDSDLHIYQDQPMSPSWESGWYNTGEYKVYWADTVEPIAFEHTLFYYNNAPGETYLEFMPETFYDNWNLLKLYLYWDEDEQKWFPDSIGIDTFIGENSSGIPTSSAVRSYVQNNVIHHLQAPVAAVSDLSQGLYVADSDLRLVTAYEQVQLNSGDFIVAQASTSTPGEVYLIIVQSDKIKTGTYSTMDEHLTTTDFELADYVKKSGDTMSGALTTPGLTVGYIEEGTDAQIRTASIGQGLVVGSKDQLISGSFNKLPTQDESDELDLTAQQANINYILQQIIAHNPDYTTIDANIANNSKNNMADGVHAFAVGNGVHKNFKSNAFTVNYDGTGWFSGDVYVGSTSGTNRDSGSKRVLTEADLPNVNNYYYVESAAGTSITLTQAYTVFKIPFVDEFSSSDNFSLNSNGEIVVGAEPKAVKVEVNLDIFQLVAGREIAIRLGVTRNGSNVDWLTSWFWTHNTRQLVSVFKVAEVQEGDVIWVGLAQTATQTNTYKVTARVCVEAI